MNWNKTEIGYLKENFSSSKDKSVAAFLNKSSNAIRIKAIRLKLKKESTTYRTSLVLTQDEEQIILGGLMGDLHCRMTYTSKNARLEGGHGSNQIGYLNYKIKLLGRLNWNVRLAKDGSTHYESKSFQCLNQYFILFYPNNKKVINIKILDRIDKLGLLIWYLDDGNYHLRDKTSRIFTNGFSYEEQLIIKKWFEDKWNISPKIYQYRDQSNYPDKIWYYLNFSVSETKRLHGLFINFNIPECMKYKFYYNHESHLPKPVPEALIAYN